MSLDTRIREAIVKTVRDYGQDASLSNKIVAWMEALSEHNETLEDNGSKWTRVELLYEATAVEVADELEV